VQLVHLIYRNYLSVDLTKEVIFLLKCILCFYSVKQCHYEVKVGHCNPQY
jgi:hypothetical protein